MKSIYTPTDENFLDTFYLIAAAAVLVQGSNETLKEFLKDADDESKSLLLNGSLKLQQDLLDNLDVMMDSWKMAHPGKEISSSGASEILKHLGYKTK